MKIVEIENLVKRYGDLVALDHLQSVYRGRGGLWTSGTERKRENDGNQLYVVTPEI